MTQIESYDVLTEILRGKNSCTINDLVRYKTEKESENPDLYVDVTKLGVLSAINSYPNEFYWDEKERVVHKQETIKCFICDEVHRMFPDVQNFLKIKERIESIKNKL